MHECTRGCTSACTHRARCTCMHAYAPHNPQGMQPCSPPLRYRTQFPKSKALAGAREVHDNLHNNLTTMVGTVATNLQKIASGITGRTPRNIKAPPPIK